MSPITPVILVGASGRPLWPMSRESLPRAFLPVLGKQSAFQQTLMRVSDRSLFGKPLIATSDDYRIMAEQQAIEIGMEIETLIEPSRRDSGPTMAAAAAHCRSLGAKAVLALASDHLVIGVDELRAACRRGLTAVDRGGIVTLGVQPTEPWTGCGYIEPGAEHIGPVHKVARYIEKPDTRAALRYFGAGFLWNSGNFLFPPTLLLSEMTKFEPAMAEAAQEAVAKARKTGSTVFLDAEAFAKAPAKSIDYAVMERTDKCWVVPATSRWPDPDVLSDSNGAAAPAQSPAPIVVHLRNSRVAPVRDPSSLASTEADFDEWRSVVASHAAELCSHDFPQGTNHERVRRRLLSLSACLSGDVAAIRAEEFRLGYELELFEALITAYNDSLNDLPAIRGEILAELNIFARTVSGGIGHLDRWVQFTGLAALDPKHEGEADPKIVAEHVEELAEATAKEATYFDPQLPASLRFIAEALRDPAGATKTMVYGAVKSVENVLAFLAERALGIGRNAVSAVEGNITKAVAAGLVSLLGGIGLSLSGSLPQAWTWLKPVLDAIARGIAGTAA